MSSLSLSLSLSLSPTRGGWRGPHSNTINLHHSPHTTPHHTDITQGNFHFGNLTTKSIFKADEFHLYKHDEEAENH